MSGEAAIVVGDQVGDVSYRSDFDQTIQLVALSVSPKESTGIAMKHLRGCLFVHRGVRNVIDGTCDSSKHLLLDPSLLAPPPEGGRNKTSVLTNSLLPEDLKRRISLAIEEDGRENDKKKNRASSTAAEKKPMSIEVLPSTVSVHLSYKNFTMPEMLKKLLPPRVVALSGFEQVGHIAHVNLSTEHIPYQFKIGQVIIDTNPTVKTVVNKVDSISSVFREFKMEVIGGSRNASMLAVVKQHGCVFHVPYDKVYWNSRLEEEHERLVGMLQAGDELFDVMAGIGPFAVPAASRGVVVHANDLNPVSYEYLKVNAEVNHVTLNAYNMDGRDFLEMIRTNYLEKSILPDGKRRHATMNLPALAVTFLDVFTRLEWSAGKILDSTFLVHCYTFSADKDPMKDAVMQIEAVMKTSLLLDVEEGRGSCVERVHLVRDVAPTKQMVCVSFRLPLSLTKCISGPLPVPGPLAGGAVKRPREEVVHEE